MLIWQVSWKHTWAWKNVVEIHSKVLLTQRKELEYHPCMDWKIDLETAVYQSVRSTLNSFSIPSIKNISITKLQLNFAEFEVVNKNAENENVIPTTTSKSDLFYIGKRDLFGVTFHKEKTDFKIIKEKGKKIWVPWDLELEEITMNVQSVREVFINQNYLAAVTDKKSFIL